MERGEGMGRRLRGISGSFERSCCIQQVASKGEMVYVKCRVRIGGPPAVCVAIA